MTQDERMRERTGKSARGSDQIDWPTALRHHRGLLALVVLLTTLIMVAVIVLAIGIANRLERLASDPLSSSPTAHGREGGP